MSRRYKDHAYALTLWPSIPTIESYDSHPFLAALEAGELDETIAGGAMAGSGRSGSASAEASRPGSRTTSPPPPPLSRGPSPSPAQVPLPLPPGPPPPSLSTLLGGSGLHHAMNSTLRDHTNLLDSAVCELQASAPGLIDGQCVLCSPGWTRCELSSGRPRSRRRGLREPRPPQTVGEFRPLRPDTCALRSTPAPRRSTTNPLGACAHSTDCARRLWRPDSAT